MLRRRFTKPTNIFPVRSKDIFPVRSKDIFPVTSNEIDVVGSGNVSCIPLSKNPTLDRESNKSGIKFFTFPSDPVVRK